MQQASTVKVPQTRAELEAMVARRSELQGQLRGAEERRFLLGEQVPRTGAETRASVIQRVEALDQRITQLERQVAQMDEAISTAMTRPEIAQGQPSTEWAIPPTPAVPPVAFPPFPDMPGQSTTQEPHFFAMRDIVVGGLLSGGLLLLVGFVTWRYAVRRFATMVGGGTSDPAHLTRLQQSVDAIAIEVERISENQRYLTKALHPGAAEPVETLARVAERVPPSGSRGL